VILDRRKIARSVLPLVLIASLAARGIAQKTSSGSTASAPERNRYSTTALLSALTDIPAWAARLQSELETQGASIDRKKANAKLLPYVISIQKTLSDLENQNNMLVAEMSKTPIDKRAAESELNQINYIIRSLRDEFSSLRVGTQSVSSPELTDLERAAEAITEGKGITVRDTLEQLGYEGQLGSDSHPQPGDETAKIDFKARSKDLLFRLHNAQDAFGKLHAYLAS
jgi:hypothetical protein